MPAHPFISSSAGVFLCALLLISCGGGTSLGDCPPNSQNQQTSGSMLVHFTCTGCHSETLSGAVRLGAPTGMDFDTPAMAFDWAEQIYETVENGSMPPEVGLNATQVEAVRVYLACGTQ